MVVLKKTKDGRYVLVKDREINSKNDDEKSEKYDENLENSATPLYSDVIEKEKRRITIDVYDAGEDEEISFDKVILRRRLKFVFNYKDVTKSCVGYIECDKVFSEIARATHYNISKKDIESKIAELNEKLTDEKEIPLIDYVKEKYGEKLAEIEKDPFAWILNRTKEIIGYERLKLLTFLALVSSHLERVMGISRIHTLIVGPSGAGKSSTVKSVLKLANDIVIQSTRITQNALGYLKIDSFDGRVLFIEQIDGQTMNYLRELMSEEKICTTVAEKDIETEEIKTRQICVEGQPVVISTSVVDTIDVNREQLFNRLIKVYVKPDVNAEHIWETILERTKVEIPIEDMLIFRAWLLSRPSHAELSEDVKEKVIKFMKTLSKYTREPINRTVEIIRNLIIAVAVTRGKAKADIDDFEFVMRNFQLDVLYNGLGLSERDVEFIEALPEEGGLKSQEVADRLRVSKQYAINVLKNLERKGIVEGEKIDGKTFTWHLTNLGRQIKKLMNNVSVTNEKVTGIADTFFRNDNNEGRDSTNAVYGDDGNGVQRGDGEINEFIEYVKRNNNATKEFFEIVQDFGDKDKANRFVEFCVSNGYCQRLNMTDFRFTYNDNEENLLLDAYKDLKGKQYAIKDFYSVLGDDLADKILTWAEKRGLVNHKIIDNEEYIEFV